MYATLIRQARDSSRPLRLLSADDWIYIIAFAVAGLCLLWWMLRFAGR